jgi:vancomycin permeability regulator SanA
MPEARDPVIVIFGAAVRPDGTPSTALQRRVQAAARFGRPFPGTLYIPTGAIGRFGASEASVMSALLRDLGVPTTGILLEETGTNTISSVCAAARLIRDHGLDQRPLVAASSAYHLPRCVTLLRLAGLPARACPPDPQPAARTLRSRWYWRLRETAALPVDAAIMVARRVGGSI